MNKFVKPLHYGSLKLANNILYAPLAGCSDYPFRRMSARYRPGLMFCEMVKMDALIRYDQNTFHYLDYDSTMRPIGAQLCGSKPEIAGQAAKILEDLGFDSIDLNCGCPVDKVTKDGSGSGLLRQPQLIGDILAEIIAAVKIPVSVKIRAGWDEKNINAAEITRLAEQAGAVAITIHGRTREQAYRGPANWEWIREAKEAANKILVIGNGDILDGPSAQSIFEQTGCDGVLIARGTLGRPWVIEEIMAYLEGNPLPPRTLEECRQVLIEHYHEVLNYHEGRGAVLDVRRIGCWYFKKTTGTKAFREQVSRINTKEDALALISEYPFEE